MNSIGHAMKSVGRIICLLFVLGFVSLSHAAVIQIGATNVNGGASFGVPVTVDAGTNVLGAYLVSIAFNTNVIQFISVSGGTGGFGTPPIPDGSTNNPSALNTNTPGILTYIHMQATSLTSPTGLVSVSRVNFNAIGAGGSSSPLTLSGIEIDNTDGNPLSVSIVNGTVNINAVIPPPVASFTASPTNGLAPLTVTFNDTSTGTITNRFWDFGDGGTTNLVNPTHTYSNAGTYTASLTVSGPVASSSANRTIVATNIPAQLVVSPSSRDYGTVLVGQTSNQTFSVINTGQVTLTGTATVSGVTFAIVSGSPFSVPGSQTGLVTVSFSPGSPVSFNDTVVFVSNGGNSSNAVAGIGLTPAQLGVSPSIREFGTIATGTTAQASFVVTNLGGSTLSGTATVSGATFAIVSGSPFTLAGSGATNVVVSFTPTSEGTFSNSVVFTSNGGNTNTLVIGTGATLPGQPGTPYGPKPYSLTNNVLWCWNPPSNTNGMTGYHLTVATGSGGNDLLDAGIGNVTCFNVTGGSFGQTQYARVYGINALGNGPTSGEGQVKLINPASDEDGDGKSNADEDFAGTDPLSSGSLLQVFSITTLTNGDVVLIWSSVPARNYQVHATTNLVTAPYVPISGVIPSQGATTGYTNAAPGASSQFYRVQVLP